MCKSFEERQLPAKPTSAELAIFTASSSVLNLHEGVLESNGR